MITFRRSTARVRTCPPVGRAVTILGTLGAALAMSSCGSTLSTEPSPEAAAYSDQLSDLYARINGDAVERSAGALVAFDRMQSKVAECMANRGHEYSAPRFVNYWEDLAPRPTHGASSLLDPLSEDFGIADQKSSSAVLYFAENGFNDGGPTPSRAFEEALDACGHAGDNAYVDIPPDVWQLRVELDNFVETATNGLGYKTENYSKCLMEHGLEGKYNSDLYTYVAARFPSPLESPAANGSASEAWQEAVDLEREVAQIDVSCRVDIFNEGMQLVGPRLDEWISSHSEELEAVEDAWSARVQQASELPQWPRVAAGLAPPSEG